MPIFSAYATQTVPARQRGASLQFSYVKLVRSNPGQFLSLGQFRSGLKPVADTLFTGCGQIDYECGPRWTITSADITAGFHVFQYNMEVRREQTLTAAARSTKATGYSFSVPTAPKAKIQFKLTQNLVNCTAN